MEKRNKAWCFQQTPWISFARFPVHRQCLARMSYKSKIKSLEVINRLEKRHGWICCLQHDACAIFHVCAKHFVMVHDKKRKQKQPMTLYVEYGG